MIRLSHSPPLENTLPEWVRDDHRLTLSDTSNNVGDREHPLLTSTEAARHLRISPRTLRRMVKSGKLTAIRIGRQLRFDRDIFWLEISNLDNRRD